MASETNETQGKRPPDCNVSMRFNFAIGGIAIAIAVALLIAYLVFVRH